MRVGAKLLSCIADLISFVGGAVLLSYGIAALVSNVVTEAQSHTYRTLGLDTNVDVPEAIMWGVGLIVLGVVRVHWRKETKREE